MLRPILKDTSAKDKALRESWMSEPPGNNGINISHTHGHRPASGTPGSSSSSPSPITPPKSLARANSASAKRQSKLRSTVEHDQDALTPRPRQPPVNGYGPDYRPRRQSGGPGHLLYALDPSSGGVDESEDNEDSDFDDSFSRSKHLQDQYARLQKSQLRQSMLENPILPHGTADNNTPYDKPRQRKSLGDELNVPPVPEKSAQRKRVSTMGSATLPAVSPSLSAALTSVSEAIIVRSDSKKQKDRKPFATVGSNALSFEPLFALKDGSPKQSRESSVLTTYRDSLASRLSGVSDSDWAGNPLLMDIIQPGVSILDLSKKDLTEIPSGLPTSITHLRLAYNSIHNLAPLASLTSLHYLQVLDLCDNQLDTLPSEIGLLSKLKELYLSNNKLWKLPDTIHRMARLEVLDIRGNQFYLLNPMIGRLKTLRQLDVRNNQLKSLPAPLCMLSSTLSVLLVDGNQFVQPFSDLLQPLFTTDSDSGPQSFLGDDPYADSGRKNTGSVSTLKSTGVYEPWRRSVVPSAPKRVPTLIKRRSHGDLMTIIGLQKKEGYSNSTDDLAAELQKANTISGSSGAYIAASLSASDSSPGRRERSVSTSNTGPSEFQSESGSSHPLSLNKFIKSFRKSSRSSLKEPSVSSSKKRLSVGSELDPSEDGQGSESVYGGSQYEQEDSGKGAHPSKRGPTGGINQWVRDRFHKRANSNELGSLPNASSTSINLDTQDSEPHAVRDSGYGGGGTTHSPDFSAPSGLARMNKSTGHLPFGSPVSPRDTQLLSSFDPLFKKERDYRFSYMSMESQMTQGTENDIDALDISAPLAHRLSSMHSPTTPLPSSPVMLATSTAGSISVWNSGAGPRYGQSAAQMKPIMQYLKDLHDLDPDSSEWEEVYAWRRVWNAERSTTLGLTGNDAEREQEQEEGDQQAKAEEIRLAKLQAQATRRRKIMAEIIETERTYVDGLKGLVEIYLTPAQQVMPASDHKAVFSNAQALYTFHASHFLPELEKAYAVTRETKVPIASSSPMSPIPSSSPFLSDPSAPSSASSSTAALGVHHESGGQSLDISVMSTPHDSCIEATNETTDSVTTPQPEECRIGRVFAEHVAYMKMYSFYVNNYDNALRVLQTQLTNSKYKKKTKEFLRRCAKHPNHTQLGLQGYLLLPVQRIPRYKMLLGDLLENTWPDHVDYQDIATALDKISSRADEMNERKRQYENHEKVLLVQNRIVGQYKTPLVQPHRKVVREGMLHLIRTVTRNVSMSEKAVVPSGQTPVGDLTVHHLSEETVEKSFLFILFNDILIQCQPSGPKASGAAAHLTGAGAGSTGGMGGSGVIAGGSSANLGASDSAKNLELCRVLQLESRLHPAEVIGNDVLRVVDDAMVMYLTGDKDVIQAWKEDINSRWVIKMVDLKTVAFTNLSKLRIICSLVRNRAWSPAPKNMASALFDEVNASSDDENNGYGSDRGDGASSSDEDEEDGSDSGDALGEFEGPFQVTIDQTDVAVDAIPSSEPQEVYNADADVHDLASKYTQHQYMLHSHPNLGHLEIDGELQGFEKDLLVSFLTTSGSLKIFKCPETDSFGNKEVPAALTKTGVFLEEPHSYDFLLGTNSIDLNIAVTVFRHPRLKTI
ncbi:hypothetical protein BGZ52_008115 [Haplosporangium bisporale]|nr:hypothetical protein BGZ52_008115 [Haplosporangium bisporale]